MATPPVQANDPNRAIGSPTSVALAYPDYFHNVRLQLQRQHGGTVSDDAIKKEIAMKCSAARAMATSGASHLSVNEATARFPRISGKNREFSFDRFWTDMCNLGAAASIMHGYDIVILSAEHKTNGTFTVRPPWVSSQLLKDNVHVDMQGLFDDYLSQKAVERRETERRRLEQQEREAEADAKRKRVPEAHDLVDSFMDLAIPSTPRRHTAPLFPVSAISTPYKSKPSTEYYSTPKKALQLASSSTVPASPIKSSPMHVAPHCLATLVTYLKRMPIPPETRGQILAAVNSGDSEGLDIILQDCDVTMAEVIRSIIED